MGGRPFFTIGHSNRTFEAFARLLTANAVEVLVDVRAFPRSRTNPQFNAEVLPSALVADAVAYERIPALGGLRGRSETTDAHLNDAWRNASFRRYADYALTPAFHEGLRELLRLGEARTCAIMCAEAVWWRCHRRIVADYLIAAGREVFHIMGPGQTVEARLPPDAQVQPDGRILYPQLETQT